MLQSFWSETGRRIHVTLFIVERERKKKGGTFFEKEKHKIECRAWSSINKLSDKGKKNYKKDVTLCNK